MSAPGGDTQLSPATSTNPAQEGGVQEEPDLYEAPEEEEEVSVSAHLEPVTLPWPGDKVKLQPPADEKAAQEDEVRGEGAVDQEGEDRKTKWRESMPEGERWRDDVMEAEHQGDGSLADDEEEDDEEEEDESYWVSEKTALGITPQVTIVRRSSEEPPEESRLFIEKEAEVEPFSRGRHLDAMLAEEEDDKYYHSGSLCSEKVRVSLATAAAAVLFPLLVWGGYALLPFDSPLLQTTPLRVVYTLRCSFFAIIPILLGVVVQGLAWLRHGDLQPLYQNKLPDKEVTVHWHYVNESLSLFLFYFLQLAVMATYVSQDLVKLVPLLTIVFAFGRLVYWLCLCLGSSIRGLGFGFSYFPILVMLGANLYYICSGVGQGAVFDVAPPTTAPPPRQRWWG
ncbi:uncharacterized protein tmem79a isoform 1-T3 [Synchiropus picturatus]